MIKLCIITYLFDKKNKYTIIHNFIITLGEVLGHVLGQVLGHVLLIVILLIDTATIGRGFRYWVKLMCLVMSQVMS